MSKYILKGRSIDGTVYFDHGSWTTSIHNAERMSNMEAEFQMGIRITTNKRVELDDKIGHLEVVDAPPVHRS